MYTHDTGKPELSTGSFFARTVLRTVYNNSIAAQHAPGRTKKYLAGNFQASQCHEYTIIEYKEGAEL
jgi:hypothetical protein